MRGQRKRPNLREFTRATIRYAVLFIVIELMGAAIIMYVAARKDSPSNHPGAANQPAAAIAGK